MTARDVKFSLAMSWRPVVWRSSSRERSASTSVSGSVSEGNGITDLQGSGGRSEVGFEVGELGDAAGVATALERRREERREDLLGEPRADDAGPDGQHVGVVVGTRHARRVEIVAEGRAHAADLVRRQLLALPAAAQHDPELGVAAARSAAATAEQKIG